MVKRSFPYVDAYSSQMTSDSKNVYFRQHFAPEWRSPFPLIKPLCSPLPTSSKPDNKVNISCSFFSLSIAWRRRDVCGQWINLTLSESHLTTSQTVKDGCVGLCASVSHLRFVYSPYDCCTSSLNRWMWFEWVDFGQEGKCTTVQYLWIDC